MAEETPQILFQDEQLLLLFKPAGWFVHPPENPRFRRGLKRRTAVQWLSDVHGLKAFPAHRIDAATEGILILGKDKESTANLNLQFKNREVQKTYQAAVRGWMPEESGRIELPLLANTTGEWLECETSYRVLSRIELGFRVQPQFPTSRYSLLEVKPRTGRWHQIRRHMNRVAHPIIGDREHGDGRHNAFFRDQMKIDGLCLWACGLRLRHPKNGEKLDFSSPVSKRWVQLTDLFKISK